MRLRGLGAWILLQVLLQPWQLEVSAAGLDGPGKGNCHPECLKHGNCGDDGMCRCPFGRIGDGCEIDFLRPCKQRPDGIPSCGMLVTKSCECMRRCRKYHCRTDSTGQTHCETRDYASDRGCYMRDGVGQDEQFSLVPEANETGVKYFEGYAEDAKEVPRGVALFDKSSKTESAPLSQCSSSCNGKGYCTTWDKQNYLCQCYRGYAGSMCELEAPSCILNCSGRGKCIDDFCHCKPPYFSIGCSRSKVYPKNYSKPNPAALKIYMYELNTQLAYDSAPHVGWKDNNEIYTAYRKFLARFLLSSVRTEDPSEASLFYIPSFTLSYSGNLGSGWEHTWLLLDDLRTKWPYWNQSGGADHFIWMPTDRGACRWGPGPMSSLIRVTHFGMYFTPTSGGYEHFGEKGHPDYGCHHPLKDIVALAYDPRMITALAGTSMNATLEGRIAAKKRLFFIAGDVRPNDLSYAGGTRVQLETLLKKWNDDDFSWTQGGVPNYLLAFQETKFCLAPYGHGFGMRLQQSILGDCVPVIIQEHVFQPYEDMLPYEEFSLRLSNADLPKLREILRGVNDAHYKQLLAGVFRFRNAFHWDEERGSQAFDYTVGSLRRRHQHLQSSLY